MIDHNQTTAAADAVRRLAQIARPTSDHGFVDLAEERLLDALDGRRDARPELLHTLLERLAARAERVNHEGVDVCALLGTALDAIGSA